MKRTLPLYCQFAVLVVTLWLGGESPAWGQESAGGDGFLDPFLERNHLLGDPFGFSEWLENHGLAFDVVYTAEPFVNTRGGINTHDAAEYRGDISLVAELDTQAAGLWSDGQFFHLQQQHGHSLTADHVGDFQVLSNLDADDFFQISEFWYRHEFLDGRLWLKLGKQDANGDFAAVEYGLEFIHSSPGFSPTIPLVTYPDPDWGVVVGGDVSSWLSVNAGVYQGRPDGGRAVGNTIDALRGPMLMVEPVFKYHLGNRPGFFRVGGWFNGDRFESPDGLQSFRESWGWYLTWDQLVYKEIDVDSDVDDQGVGLFLQYGWAPSDRSEANHYVGGGVQWKGLISGRDDDFLGLGVFHVEFSERAGFEEPNETAVELFYKLQVLGSLSVQPDVQFIHHPGGSANKAAVAVGARIEISF